MKRRSRLMIVAVIISMLVACDKPVDNKAPTVSFTSPANNSSFMQGEAIIFSVEVDDPEEDMKEVRFYANNIGLVSDQSWPYSFDWETGSLDVGEYSIIAEAIDNDGAKGEALINVIIESNPGAPTASFLITPSTGTTSSFFEFDATASTDSEDEVVHLKVRWDWDTDGVWDTDYGTIKTTTHQFTTIGIHYIALEVQDSGGLTDITLDSVSITEIIIGSLTDIDGNIYETIQIGAQTWMAENLKVTHYRDGTTIPKVTDNATWDSNPSGAYCYYDNDSTYCDTYGALYNWYSVVNSLNIAPDGWHVPNGDEWSELWIYLGMSQGEANDNGLIGTSEGSKLAGNEDLWYDNVLGNNIHFGSSGFNAIPGGYRYYSGGVFDYLGYSGYFWSTDDTEEGSNAWCTWINHDEASLVWQMREKHHGFSVRLLRD